MINPSVEELTQEKDLNRYELALATAKAARMVTDEYVTKRAIAEKLIANKETDKSLASILKLENSDEKAVQTAVNRIHSGEIVIDKNED